MKDLDEGFRRFAEDRHRHTKLTNDLRQIDAKLETHRRQRARWRELTDRAGDAVRKLEGLGLTALFHRLLGDRREKIDSENAVLLRAKVRLEDAEAAMDSLLDERRRAVAEIDSIGDLGARELELVRAKDADVRARGGDAAARAIALAEREGQLAGMTREIDEAMAAGRQAEAALVTALDELRGAHGWGTFDLLGGGLLATAVKHGHVDRARTWVARAQRHLDTFEREVRDVELAAPGLAIDIGGLATFADYFFDGLLVDWIVLHRIETARERIGDALRRTRSVVRDLEARATDVVALLAEAKQQRVAWLGSA